MRPAACSASEACVTARRLTPSILDTALCVYVKAAVGPVMHHKEPPGHPLLSCMHGIARDRLLNLSQQRLGIADEEVANVLVSLEFRSQNLTRDAKQTALQLHETAIEGGAAVHGREETECTFTPDVRCLDRRPVLQSCQQ